MSLIEKKLDAVMQCLTADNEADREHALRKIRSLLDRADAPPSSGDLEYDIRRVLLDIGVPENIKGHRCLIKAIRIAYYRPDLIGWITKDIYPTVAKEMDTTPPRVERAIRHAIEVAWDRGDLDTIQRYFGNTISPTKGKPTNGQFISRMVNVIRQYAE